MPDLRHVSTERLHLDAPTEADLAPLHEIYADPRVWTHFPSLRHTDVDQTAAMLRRWILGWDRDGLSSWIVRDRADGPVVGNAGCMLRDGVWNLGYRLDADVHGRGYATEAARRAVAAAHEVAPDVPVTAFLVEHNHASARVAEAAGLSLRHRAPDAGNPDPSVMRLVLADRDLTDEQLAATFR